MEGGTDGGREEDSEVYKEECINFIASLEDYVYQ